MVYICPQLYANIYSLLVVATYVVIIIAMQSFLHVTYLPVSVYSRHVYMLPAYLPCTRQAEKETW